MDVDRLLDAAQSAPSLAAYEQAVLDELERAVGGDVAAYLRLEGPTTACGFHREPTWREQIVTGWPTYERELARFLVHTQREGVGVDTEFYGFDRLSTTKYFKEILAPEGARRGCSSLLAMLQHRGGHIATVVLGRRTRAFRPEEVAAVKNALSALTVCDLAMQNRVQAAFTARLSNTLSARERQILEYLRLGYDNRQIALVLGTSPNTVRNQLSRLYEKLEVTTRTEAVARAYGS